MAFSIWTTDQIAAEEFNAFSDRRAKHILRVSDSGQDLETLSQLQVTDYTFIDVVNKGDRLQKKMIAQQVQKIYPIAVSTTEDFIPNVYELSTSTAYDPESKRLTVTTAKAHGFAVGDRVRIIDETDEHEIEVLDVADPHTFTVRSDNAQEKVFVYGKKIDDFLTLAYDAIAMLNVSATQELAKRVEALKAENISLKAENAEMKKQMAQFASALGRLEALAVAKGNVDVAETTTGEE